MKLLYLISTACHLLAVIFWLGGMLFLVTVALPVLRRGEPAVMARFLEQASHRLRGLGWASLGILAVTGLFQLSVRGWLELTFLLGGSPQAWMVWGKVSLFGLIVGMSLYHDFVLGPATARAMKEAPDQPETLHFRRRASLTGRVTALLALLMVGLGVVMVRGLP